MRKALRSMKNVVYQYNDIELKVREATNNDRFLVSNSHLAAIARATNDYQEYPSLFSMLWKRLTDLEHVMHVQKALHVVEYLLRHGAERFINDAKRRARDIAALQKYKHYDENNQDDAKEARARAKVVYALLMDDQLLAQERGKSARLASEGRLGGVGHEYGGGGHTYDDDASAYDEEPAPPPVRRSAAPASSHHHSNGMSSAPPTSASSSNAGIKSGAVRRRSIDEDPFTNPVIPPVAAAATASSSGASRRSGGASATTAATAGAAQTQASRKKAEADVEEPADTDDEDEAAEAARKAAKKAKKKAKKEAEARAAAEAVAAETKAQSKALKTHYAPSSSASPPATQDLRTSSLDLLASYGNDLNNTSGRSGDVDILTGASFNGASQSNGQVGELSDLFTNQSLTDHPSNGGVDPFFSNGGGGSGAATTNFGGEDEREGYNSDHPGAESSHAPTFAHSSTAHHHAGNGSSSRQQHQPSPTNLVNLNDLLAPAVKPSSQSVVDSGVSMSMMRSIQPLGAPAQTKSTDSTKKRSNVPSSIPLPNGPADPYGFMAQSGPSGMPGGYPQPPHAHMAYQQQGMPPLGPPLGMQPGMPPLGPPLGPPMHGYGYGQQPMLAIMPPGMNSGYGAPQAHSLPYGAPVQPGYPYSSSSLPPSSSSQANTFTQMRQAPSSKSSGAIPFFEVPEAPPARPVEPVNYMTHNSRSFI